MSNPRLIKGPHPLTVKEVGRKGGQVTRRELNPIGWHCRNKQCHLCVKLSCACPCGHPAN